MGGVVDLEEKLPSSSVSLLPAFFLFFFFTSTFFLGVEEEAGGGSVEATDVFCSSPSEAVITSGKEQKQLEFSEKDRPLFFKKIKRH